MNSSRNLIIGIVLIVIVLASGAYLLKRAPAHVPPGDMNVAATTTAATTSDETTGRPVSANVDVNASGDYTMRSGAASTAPKAPDYKKPLVFSSTVDDRVRAALNAQLGATIAAIEKNPIDFEAWINLGIVRKMAGDYTGAEEIWLYTAKLYPTSTVPTDDLGVLYLDFLKNLPKAEAEFRLSIKNDPHDINAYEQLFSLYTVYGYKAGTSAAADLVAQGLKDNPGDENLLQFKEQLSAK